jgi:hypothetical protein
MNSLFCKTTRDPRFDREVRLLLPCTCLLNWALLELYVLKVAVLTIILIPQGIVYISNGPLIF